MKSSAYILSSRRVITPDGIRAAGIVVNEGIIADVVGVEEFPKGMPVEDFGDLVVMPGLIDTHVHVNEPGRTEWEGFECATKAAAAGGITTIVDMPLNSSPVTTSVEALNAKLSAAKGKLHVDCGFYAGLVPGNASDVAPLLEAGVLGVKAFLIDSGIDDFPPVSEEDLRVGMKIIAKTQAPLLVHAELADISTLHVKHGDDQSFQKYLSSRPRKWEHDAINLLIRLCAEYNCRTHIVHLSSADEIPALRSARSAELPLSVETCPHYLFFSADEIPEKDTRFKCAPPIRERENRERLWTALRDGDIDCIVSDHSPCPPEMKLMPSADFSGAWGGIASLQLGLPIVWTEASRRGFALTDVATWMSTNTARLVNLEHRKGKIARGYDADIAIWNPDAAFIVEPWRTEHRHKTTPYEGKKLYGKVERTYLAGRKVFDGGKFPDLPQGKIITRSEKIFNAGTERKKSIRMVQENGG
ncbi:MAG TPA: allantoinase AllB [Bacteroidota bacterium]|nr:allantoinase AllB [Bacteroidota bacterium]